MYTLGHVFWNICTTLIQLTTKFEIMEVLRTLNFDEVHKMNEKSSSQLKLTSKCEITEILKTLNFDQVNKMNEKLPSQLKHHTN